MKVDERKNKANRNKMESVMKIQNEKKKSEEENEGVKENG